LDGITTPLFSAWITSRIICWLFVPFHLYLKSGSTWMFSISQEIFSSTSITPMSTGRAALMMTSH
jgi:hypothetical protein